MDRRSILRYTAYLTGYAVTAPLATAFLSGCTTKTDNANGTYSPKLLTAEQYAGLYAMIDVMLPKTSTPGATELGVPEFVETVLAVYTPVEDQATIHKGLGEWLATAASTEGQNYEQLSTERQLALLNTLDQNAKDQQTALDDSSANLSEQERKALVPWWLSLKGLVINAFYLSEHMGTEVLTYEPVPGPYQGCVPLTETTGGKAYSL